MGEGCCTGESHGTCGGGECCTQSSCGSGGCGPGYKSMEDHFWDKIEMANEAWDELLKEKIKAQYEKKMGKKMDRLAEAIADAAAFKWDAKMQKKAGIKKHMEKVIGAMVE